MSWILIIGTSTSITEELLPYEKLREAATSHATLTAPYRPPAQPSVGYTHLVMKERSRNSMCKEGVDFT